MYYYQPRRRSTRTKTSIHTEGAVQPNKEQENMSQADEPPQHTYEAAPETQEALPVLDAETLRLLLLLLERGFQAAAEEVSLLEREEIVVESALPLSREGEAAEQQNDVRPLPRPVQRRRKRLPEVLVALCALSCAVVIVVFYLVPFFTASATVTIIPSAVPISATTTVHVVTTGSTNNSLPPGQHNEVPGRILSSLTFSQVKSVVTTGRGHRDAMQAHGLVTFYNALQQEQTIPAGTLLTAATGTQVVTDQDALLPAGTGATNGQVNVPAHALGPGPQGNIPAGTLSGTCCRAYVLINNLAPFTGGENARDFPTVTRHDLEGVVSSLKASLAQSIQAALQVQVRADETLITPVPCREAITPDHHVGEEAAHLAVVVDETCTGETYDMQAVHDLMTQVVTGEAAQQLGMGYSLTGELQASVIQSSVKEQKQEVTTLQVKGIGTWSYQFSNEQLQHIAQVIAGKSRQQATQRLLHTPGVSRVVMTVAGGSTSLPTDARNIHVLVLYQAT